jgi:hypothetical protein
MPTNEHVRELIRYVESGRTADALKKFYAEEVTMAENLAPPTKGREPNLKREQDFFAHVKQVHEYRAVSFLVDRDRSAIHWILDITNDVGQRMRLDEIAWQLWRGDQIIEERFVYDSNSVLMTQPSREEEAHAGR